MAVSVILCARREETYPQRMRSPQLTEQHRHKLAPTRKSFGGVLRVRRLDEPFKLGARNKLEYLAEHAA